ARPHLARARRRAARRRRARPGGVREAPAVRRPDRRRGHGGGGALAGGADARRSRGLARPAGAGALPQGARGRRAGGGAPVGGGGAARPGGPLTRVRRRSGGPAAGETVPPDRAPGSPRPWAANRSADRSPSRTAPATFANHSWDRARRLRRA